MSPLLLFSLALIGYYAIHSLLASNQFKKALIGKAIPLRLYRLFFNTVSIGLIYPLYLLFENVDKVLLFEGSSLSQIAGGVLALAGIILAPIALSNYQMSEFVGLHQLQRNEQPEGGQLQTGGLNAYVRHPLYLGVLLIVWGLFLALPMKAVLAIAVVTSMYSVVGTILEEKKLVIEFGEAYVEYQKKVPMLLPIRF